MALPLGSLPAGLPAGWELTQQGEPTDVLCLLISLF